MKTFVVYGKEIPVEMIYKRRNKRCYFRAKDGWVQFITYRKFSDRMIKELLEKHFNSIVKLMQDKQTIEDEIHFLGKKYDLLIQESPVEEVHLEENCLKVCSKDLSEDHIRIIINSFYTETLKKIVSSYQDSLEKMFSVEGVIFQFKDAKSYFGECFFKKKKIILTTRLAKYEKIYILSVLYHEFAHFLYQNHQKEFYDCLERVFPNYRQIDRTFKKIRYNEKY